MAARARRRAGARFTRARRLIRGSQFRRVFRQGRRYRDPLFTLVAASNDQPGPRLGLAISRKMARRAVDRNRLKRQVRETFRRQQVALGALDIVVMARPAARRASKTMLREHLNILWQRLSNHATNVDRPD